MFDVGFWEVSLIAIVALVVVGPERLPRLARTVGLYVGKARRVLRDVRSEIDREINRAELSEIKNIKDTVSDAKSHIDRATADVSKTLNENLMSESGTADSDADAPESSADTSSGNLASNGATLDDVNSSSDPEQNTIHNKVDDSKPEPSMPAALRSASMGGAAASASSAINAAKKTKPVETGDLPIPPEDKSDDDY